jgi:D-alanine-D-alanine ligase-like ATP-grasp enzyme
VPLGISKTGTCYIGDGAMIKLLEESHGYNGSHDFFVLDHHQNVCRNFIQCLEQLSVQPDIIFPLIHGINGEDGKMQ